MVYNTYSRSSLSDKTSLASTGTNLVHSSFLKFWSNHFSLFTPWYTKKSTQLVMKVQHLQQDYSFLMYNILLDVVTMYQLWIINCLTWRCNHQHNKELSTSSPIINSSLIVSTITYHQHHHQLPTLYNNFLFTMVFPHWIQHKIYNFNLFLKFSPT